MNFSDRLESAIKTKNSCLMLGLDPKMEKMPNHLKAEAIRRIENGDSYVSVWSKVFAEFSLEIMMECLPYIMGIKIQMAYFEVLGSHGLLAIEHIIQVAKQQNLIILIDGKRNDIGTTCEAYAEAYLGDTPAGGDALTVTPFLGSDGILPFVEKCKSDKGIFVLVKTSNPSASEFQDDISDALCSKMNEWGDSCLGDNGFSAVGAVIGATNGAQLMEYRKKLAKTWFLAPGVGAQGGSVADVMKAKVNGLGVIIPVSRSILYASDGQDYAKQASIVAQALWEGQK